MPIVCLGDSGFYFIFGYATDCSQSSNTQITNIVQVGLPITRWSVGQEPPYKTNREVFESNCGVDNFLVPQEEEEDTFLVSFCFL